MLNAQFSISNQDKEEAIGKYLIQSLLGRVNIGDQCIGNWTLSIEALAPTNRCRPEKTLLRY